MKLVAGITSKDEEWIIGKTLKVLSKFCHKIIVLDDGSSDNTIDICNSFDKVILKNRKPRKHIWDRKEAEGLNEVFHFCASENPDYILMLDSDEIPTPSLIPFLENIQSMDQRVDGYSIRMINLCKDENHYRIDKYIPKGIYRDPFRGEGWRKTVLIKYDKNYMYKYNLQVQKGGTSKYHPAPANLKKVVKIENFYGIHYGRIGEKYTSREKDKFYAMIESKSSGKSYEDCLKHHTECRKGEPIYKECEKKWFWA